MKKSLLSTAVLASYILMSSLGYAQTDEKPSNNYYKTAVRSDYGVYLLTGFSSPYTDVNTQRKSSLTFGAQGRAKATYFLDVVVDVQFGKLSAGDKLADFNNRKMKFDNSIVSATALARLAPLKFLNSIQHKSPLYYLSNLYVGTGIGLIKSKVEANRFSNPNFVFIGNYAGTDVALPIEAGITAPVFELKNKSTISLNLNYRVKYVMSDKIDGYVTPVALNDRKDVYNTFNVGVGYNW